MRTLLALWALFLAAPALVGQCVQPFGTSYGSGDDFIANGGVGIDMGFPFPIGGVTYQYIHPSSNGFAHLSDGTVTITNSDYSPSVLEMYTLEPRLAAFWRDLVLDALNNGELFVDTSIAGQCTVTWSNAVLWGQATIFSIQLTIHATGDWDVVWDASVYHTWPAMVGVSPGFGIATAPPGSDLSTGTPILTDMAYELFPANTFDLAGVSLAMAPTVPGYVPVVGNSGCATKETYGQGCGYIANAVEELFPLGTIDICGSGTAITFLRTGSEYTILDSIPGVYVPPVAGTVVSAGDDAYGLVPLSIPMPTVAGSTQSLQVCTNGYIALSPNPPATVADYSPSQVEFAAFTEPTICGPWYDWSPNVGGQILYEEIGGIMYITWEAVTPFGVATTDTFQYQFELATGTCTIVYDATSYGGASAWHTPLFGYTAGNASYAESLDMSAALASVLGVPDVGNPPVVLDSNTPVIGGLWDLTTTNIDPLSPIAITFFGTARQDPGVPMVLIGLNAPGCAIYLNTIIGDLTAPAVGAAATATLAIPNSSGLQGGVLTAQSVCLTLTNAANLLTSNGVEGTIGN